MAKGDIYGNKRRYENLVSNLQSFLEEPKVKKGGVNVSISLNAKRISNISMKFVTILI